MANSLYITSTEAYSGKSVICLGVMEMLMRMIDKVAFFRPIIQSNDCATDPCVIDHDINLIAEHFKLDIPVHDMYAFTAAESEMMWSMGRRSELVEQILAKNSKLEENFDFVLYEGTDFVHSTSAFEFDINSELAKLFQAPVLLVANAHNKSVDETARAVELSFDSLRTRGCEVVATIVNRVRPGEQDVIIKTIKQMRFAKNQLVYAVPNRRTLSLPTVGEVAKSLGAKVLYGHEHLNRNVHSFTVAAMQMHNFLQRINHGTLVITSGDRADVLVASLASLSSQAMPKIAGIILTGGLLPEEPIRELITGFSRMAPVLSVAENTYPTAIKVEAVCAKLAPSDDRKIARALAVFEKSVDDEALAGKIVTSETSMMTPKMFEYRLLQRARKHKQHIVLPEGEDERILRAAEILLSRDIVDITLLGNEDHVRDRIREFSLRLEDVPVVDPQRSDKLEDYAQLFYELRKHKGITPENARDAVSDASYFGTMMVHVGDADGMVSGAVHTTAATVRPAFEIIKTKPGTTVVSSVFFMCLAERVLVYGDCAVNPNPTAAQLSEIALDSALTAKTFGIEPRVAMLSYSTGDSGAGLDVDKVREATALAKEKAAARGLDLKLEGPIQYDAAVDSAVAQAKMPGSEVAGHATVFIFPDLNTGNNTYKAVQRSAKALAIGPVLQGLNKPVNDLSRGCTISDVLNTIAITAIQAQAVKGLK